MRQHRDGNGLAHGLGAPELHDRLLIEHGGHGQLPLLIAARVHVQGVHAVFREIFGQLNPLGQLAEAGVLHAVVRAELDQDRHLLTCAFAHGGDLLEQEGGAALDVSAVLVRAGVPCGGEELVVGEYDVGVAYAASVQSLTVRSVSAMRRCISSIVSSWHLTLGAYSQPQSEALIGTG